MNILEVKKHIKIKDLSCVNFYNIDELREDQVVICKSSDTWSVFITDERANPIDGSFLTFDTEEDALDNLIKRAEFVEKNIRKKK